MPANLDCPICQSKETRLFFERLHVPANQNLIVSSALNAKNIPRGRLSLYKCHSCGFVFNGAFDDSLLQYGDLYDNTQDRSPSFQIHLNELLSELVIQNNFQNHQFIEIGCGKGRFLEALITHPLSKNFGIGFDPTYMGNLNLYEGRLKFQKRFYDESCTSVRADVVICRHVIEHIAKPVHFLKSIKNVLINSPNARLFFETPCLEWILENKAVWDFFYEHCSYFTKDSLSLAFENAGFHVEQVRHVFGGQYLWLEATAGRGKNLARSSIQILDMMDQYLSSENELKRGCEELIKSFLKEGKIAIWGAGAKGVTFANLFDPNGQLFECIIDVNPQKQGCFLPGTGHPIIGINKLKEIGVSNAFLMNPNYKTEIQRSLAENNININLVDIHE